MSNITQTAKNLGFVLRLGTHSDATKDRWFWFKDASGRAGEAWRVVGAGLNIAAHPGFATEEDAAFDAVRTLHARLSETLYAAREMERDELKAKLADLHKCANKNCRSCLDCLRRQIDEQKVARESVEEAEADRMRWCATEAVKWPLSTYDVREVLSMAKDDCPRALALLDFYGKNLGMGEGYAWMAMRQLAWNLRQQDAQKEQASR